MEWAKDKKNTSHKDRARIGLGSCEEEMVLATHYYHC